MYLVCTFKIIIEEKNNYIASVKFTLTLTLCVCTIYFGYSSLLSRIILVKHEKLIECFIAQIPSSPPLIALLVTSTLLLNHLVTIAHK